MEYLHLANFWGEISSMAAQVSPSSPSPEIDLLLKQIDYLQDANVQLNNSYRNFVDTIRNIIYTIATILGLSVFSIPSIYRNNLNNAIEEVKKQLDNDFKKIIDKEVDKRIASTIGYRLELVEKVLEQEAIINKTKLFYLIYSEQPNISCPPEYEIFQNRGFKPEFITSIDNQDFSKSVVILDFTNLATYTDKEKDMAAILEKIILKIKSSNKSVLVIYYNEQSKAFDKLRQDRVLSYYAIANTQVSLMGYVVDSASILKGLK